VPCFCEIATDQQKKEFKNIHVFLPWLLAILQSSYLFSFYLITSGYPIGWANAPGFPLPIKMPGKLAEDGVYPVIPPE
jgi:hypothetical protein